MRTITFQVGVDILGFPIYHMHYVSENCGAKWGTNNSLITSCETVKQV